MEKFIRRQDYNLYTEQDHQTWSLLCERHSSLSRQHLSNEYLEGYEQLMISPFEIANIDVISERLNKILDWTLVSVNGLLPPRDFFHLLLTRRYPVTVSIRSINELEFSEQPDIFHDVCGHLPLLTNEKFTKFLTAYSSLAIRYLNDDNILNILSRLYWFTYETGVIKQDDKYKAYGGAIITSSDEMSNFFLDSVPKHAFDLDRIFSTSFNSFYLQKEYFTIDSFDELFESIKYLETSLLNNVNNQNIVRNYFINDSLTVGFNDVIGFLNSIQHTFPSAISFAAGQPDDRFFNINDSVEKFDVFAHHASLENNETIIQAINNIGQYNKTKGIINEIVAEHLRLDENITVKPEEILLTVGAQEAFSIIVSTICNDNDVILIEDPSYIGLSSFAKVFGYTMQGIPINDEGIILQELEERIVQINRSGKNCKILYVIPDYQNPTGACMPSVNREKLLGLALKYNFLIIEDSVYNSFSYSQDKLPTLKSLDKKQRVIYVGSFSKSLFPGLRVGIIASDQKITNIDGEVICLIEEMAKVKALLTNNTSTISQAIVGGVLLHNQYSLVKLNEKKIESYRQKQQQMFDSLHKYIGCYEHSWAKGIYWNKPTGGFFIKLTLPFNIDNHDVYTSAKTYNIIFCPMSYFYLKDGGEREIRLTFSNLSLTSIDIGIKSLADFLQSKATNI